MLGPWFYVEDEFLVAIYRKSVKKQYNKDFIEFMFNEITKRNLKFDKPIPLKRIK
jgi:hypothetical protein